MILKDRKLFYIGGVVRDEMLGFPSIDTDYCYEGNAIEFAMQNYADHIVKKNPDFGTVRLIIDNNEIDIASTREEIYPLPGHLPKVTNIGCSIEKDLFRRDFAINAMAKNTMTGEIVDLYNGQCDIKNKKLKVLHDKSFTDDPTRIIRGLKFAVRFGFELDEKTKELQNNYLENINYDMSYHRIKKELMETFNLNKGIAFDKFIDQNIYKLLGINQRKPQISGDIIESAISDFSQIKNPWLIYMSFFDLSNLPLTHKEQSILDWVQKLKTQNQTNNTPLESILIYNITKGEMC